MNDTICAIATSLGAGAISIIKISGPNSVENVNKITKFKRILSAQSHSINYDYIIENDKIVDEVLINIMLSPKSFTTEDVVEINCHGGIIITNKILELLLTNGCRLAEAGEFTKRAFLNGRIDLIEAESVMDLINSKSEKSRILAINQLSGKVSSEITKLRKIISKIIANIEVNIDYPEYEDIEIITIEDIKNKVITLKEIINKIIKQSENGTIIKNGINIALIGSPNVGKSSLLNCLLEEEKAIVTEIEGTTRDVVEGSFVLDGILLNILDTAGIRKTSDKVEQIGVLKSLGHLETSDLVIFMLDNSKKMNSEDLEIMKKIKTKNHIIVINKTDLNPELEIEKIESDKIVKISVLEEKGIENLKNMIKEIFNFELIELEDLTYLTNARSVALLKGILNNIQSLEDGIESNISVDMLEIDLKQIWNILGQVIGENYDDELIEQLFSQFCLGK